LNEMTSTPAPLW